MSHRASIGAAVVGLGFGARVQVPSLRRAGFEVMALVGRQREKTARVARELEIPNACRSLSEALSVQGVDAVCIATPPSTHAQLALEAITAGRHVLCEKPFTLNAAEAEEVLLAAERAEIVHAVGHEFRWVPSTATVGRLLRQGAIGIPKMVSLVECMPFTSSLSTGPPSWFSDISAGGGWLGARGSHTIDQLLWWLGPFDTVNAGMTRPRSDSSVADDGYTARFRTLSGVEGLLLQTSSAWTYASLTVLIGSDGSMGCDFASVWMADHEGRREIPVPADLELPTGLLTDEQSTDIQTSVELQHYTQLCRSFGEAIRPTDSPTTIPLPSFRDGLTCMDVIDAIRLSAQQHGSTVEVTRR